MAGRMAIAAGDALVSGRYRIPLLGALADCPNPFGDVMPALTGLFTGGCVARGTGSRFRAMAHAHTRGPFTGWVCFLTWKRVLTPAGEPSAILWHEYAHVLSGAGHTEKWRRVMRELGQPVPEHYHSRPCIRCTRTIRAGYPSYRSRTAASGLCRRCALAEA